MASSGLARGAGPDGVRVVAMLRELAELTSDEAGAQRVAWTDVWQTARAFLREQLRELPVTIRADTAGNQWARLPGGGSGTVIIGSHLDSVPDGGWLDGAYGVMCAVEVLRTLAAAVHGGSGGMGGRGRRQIRAQPVRLFGRGGNAERGRRPRACRRQWPA